MTQFPRRPAPVLVIMKLLVTLTLTLGLAAAITPAQAAPRLVTWGLLEVLHPIGPIKLRGENGEALNLGYKTTFVVIGAPFWFSDDGYVLIPQGSVSTYYPVVRENIGLWQAEGLLPSPLPQYEVPYYERLLGFLGWILLGLAVMGAFWTWTWSKLRRSKPESNDDLPRATPLQAFAPVAPTVAPSHPVPILVPEAAPRRLYDLSEQSDALAAFRKRYAARAVLGGNVPASGPTTPEVDRIRLSTPKRMRLIVLSLLTMPIVTAFIPAAYQQQGAWLVTVCLLFIAMMVAAAIATLLSFRGRQELVLDPSGMSFPLVIYFRVGVGAMGWPDLQEVVYSKHGISLWGTFTQDFPNSTTIKSGRVELPASWELSPKELAERIVIWKQRYAAGSAPETTPDSATTG